MPVGLRDAQIDRQVGAAGERHLVLERDAPAPVRFGQAIDAEPPPEPAAVERDRVAVRVSTDPPRPTRCCSRGATFRCAAARATDRCPPCCRWSPNSTQARCRVLSSVTRRSGLRKFTGANRAMRLPLIVNFPCQLVSRPRPRYSAPSHSTRTRAPRSLAAYGRTVCTTRVPCSTSTRSIGAVPITCAASRIGTAPGRMMSPIRASRVLSCCAGPSCGSSENRVTGASNRPRDRARAACRSCRSGGAPAAPRTARRA